MKTLRRSTTNRVLGGVCGGIAEYFNLDPVLIRLIFVITAIFGGAGIILYILAWIIMPEKGNIQDAKINSVEDATIVEDAKNEVKNEFDNVINELKNEFKDIEKEIDEKGKKCKHSSGWWIGIFLIFLGTAFLFKQLDWIHFSWCGIGRFWPLILIFIGISCIPMKRWLKNSLLCLSLLGLLIAMTCGGHSNRCYRSNHNHSECSVFSTNSNKLTLQTFRIDDNAKLKIDVGATNVKMDLSAFELEEIEINSGVANIDLTIGEKQPKTKIEINTGVSNIKIRIPENADCKVIAESFLMSKKLNGFVKNEGVFQTENFGSATQTITIEIDGAIGNFEIIRY
ncbi:MAG: PspC domain-containing protein [Bacteroidales bacterium]|nr:PspC domain-containing protein [Bacteroidales bacterium]